MLTLASLLYGYGAFRHSRPKDMGYKFFRFDKMSLLAILFGFTVAFFITIFSPFPYMWANDVFRHNNVVLMIIDNNELAVMVPYLLTMHIPLAMVSSLFNIENTYVFFWVLRFLTYPILAFGTYLLSYEISQDKKIGIIASLLSVWQFSKLYQFAPKTNLVILFPFLFYIIIKYADKYEIYRNVKSRFMQNIMLITLTFASFIVLYSHQIVGEYIGLSLLLLLIIAATKLTYKPYYIFYIIFMTSFLIHIMMGFVICVLLSTYLVLLTILKARQDVNWRLYLIVLILLIIPIIWQLSNQDVSFGVYSDIPGDFVNMNIYDKVDFAKEIYSPATVILAIFGLIILCIRSTKTEEIPIIFICILIIFLYVLPISSSIRFINVTTSLFAYMGAITLKYFIAMSGKLYKFNAKHLVLTVMTVILVLSLVTHNIDTIYKKSNGEFTQFNHNIYSAGLWVRNNTDENTLIISDLPSQEIIAGLSNRKKIGQLLKSSYFPSKYPQYNEIIQILHEKDSEVTYERINDLKMKESVFGYSTVYGTVVDRANLTPLVVIDRKRTKKWAQMSNDDFRDSITKFSNRSYFKNVYFEDGIYIYELI